MRKLPKWVIIANPCVDSVASTLLFYDSFLYAWQPICICAVTTVPAVAMVMMMRRTDMYIQRHLAQT
jgi:hypothetical protein